MIFSFSQMQLEFCYFVQSFSAAKLLCKEAFQLICAGWREVILRCLEGSRNKAVLLSNHSHQPPRGSRLKKMNFDIGHQANMNSHLVYSHQEAVWRGSGLSRACSRRGGEGRPPACGSRLPSSAPLPRIPSHSPCSGLSSPCCSDIPWEGLCSPWKDRSSPWKGRGSLLKDQSSPLKEGGILLRGPGSPWVDPGSLWYSLCAPQIPASYRACSLQNGILYYHVWLN